jgi:lipopolysaccharide/colanic/teichoic acid biosynthesis glycosyltransferase
MYANGEQLLEEHLRRDQQTRAEWQRFFKLRHDPRILPIIGNLMRRSSADELPQLWNVIRGDMSLVGPRPLPAYHAEQFDDEFRALRTGVLPGITGLWQVSSRSEGDLQILRQQDFFYIRNWSPWLDFYILLQTGPAVLSAKGARWLGRAVTKLSFKSRILSCYWPPQSSGQNGGRATNVVKRDRATGHPHG